MHIDGFVAIVAHTVVLGGGPSAPVSGDKANLVAAAYYAAEAALRLMKAGAKSKAVPEAVAKVAAAFGVTPVVSMQAQELAQWSLETPKTVPMRVNAKDPDLPRFKEVEFEKGQAWAVDVAMSTGEGKPKDRDTRTTVWKKNAEVKFQVKGANARKLMADVAKRFPTLPFTLRAFEDERAAKAGVLEPKDHGVLSAFPVQYEPADRLVAHFKFTALLLEGGTLKITGGELPAWVTPSKELPEDVKALLATQPYVKRAKGGGGAAAAAAAAAGAMQVE